MSSDLAEGKLIARI